MSNKDYVLHGTDWREPLRDRIARWLFVNTITRGYADDLTRRGFGEIQAMSERRASK